MTMPNTPVLMALLTAFSMAGGQLLFKLGASSWKGSTPLELAVSFTCNPFLMSAVTMYAATILIWIHVLRTLPLAVAYPLTALSYIIVPILSYCFLHEKISGQTAIGSIVIIIGIIITHWQKG